jgi:hypothetical protein
MLVLYLLNVQGGVKVRTLLMNFGGDLNMVSG